MHKIKPGNAALAAAAVLFVVTALITMWNVDNRDGIHCGSLLSPNNSSAELADAKQRTKDAQRALQDDLMASGGDLNAPGRTRYSYYSADSQVADCAEARKSKTPIVVVFGVGTLALLVVGVLRRYQPRTGSSGSSSAGPKPA